MILTDSLMDKYLINRQKEESTIKNTFLLFAAVYKCTIFLVSLNELCSKRRKLHKFA